MGNGSGLRLHIGAKASLQGVAGAGAGIVVELRIEREAGQPDAQVGGHVVIGVETVLPACKAVILVVGRKRAEPVRPGAARRDGKAGSLGRCAVAEIRAAGGVGPGFESDRPFGARGLGRVRAGQGKDPRDRFRSVKCRLRALHDLGAAQPAQHQVLPVEARLRGRWVRDVDPVEEDGRILLVEPADARVGDAAIGETGGPPGLGEGDAGAICDDVRHRGGGRGLQCLVVDDRDARAGARERQLGLVAVDGDRVELDGLLLLRARLGGQVRGRGSRR